MRRIFAISDLHLSSFANKPMDVFGPNWDNHPARIANAWNDMIGDDDLVLIAGDISWAMRLAEVEEDLAWIAALPGTKILIRGNHDYWWQSIGKVRAATPDSLHFLQNDIFTDGEIAIAGTRLWDFPDIRWTISHKDPTTSPATPITKTPRDTDANDEKIRRREMTRLRMSLALIPDSAALRIVMLHYPPIGEGRAPNAITALLDEFSVDVCVYGHLHALSPACAPSTNCKIGKTRYILTSCDWLDFRPKCIWPNKQ